jgi:general secretion pathway protein M
MTMGAINREHKIAIGAVVLLSIICLSSVALSLQSRSDAVQELSERQEVLSRLEARARPRTTQRAPTKPTAAPAQAFLDATTPGLASADLQAYVARLADQHAVLVSFGMQPSAGEDGADAVRIEASMDISLRELQVMLYQLESGTPYVFVESLTVRATDSAAGVGAEDAPLRVNLGLRALWRRKAA